MSANNRDKIRSAFPFLAQNDSRIEEQFLTHGQFIKLSIGEHVEMEGNACAHLAFLLYGQVRVYKLGETGHEITLYRIDPGESCILTASCILSHDPFPAFAIAETDIEAVVIPSPIFRNWVDQFSFWRNYIFSVLSKRLSNVMAIVEEVAFKRMNVRIAHFLIQKTSSSTQKLNITHQQIAAELGTSREVVSRILKDFENRQYIHLGRNQIEIHNSAGLMAVAQS